MRELITLQITLFSMVGLGLIVRKLNIVSREGQKSINRLVIHLVLPCNIVQSFVMESSGEMLQACVAIFLVSAGIQVFAVWYGKFLYGRKEENRQISLRYGIICSNAGFLGNPIAEGIYGPEGLMLASIFLIPVRVMMWSSGLALFEGQTDKKKLIKKVLTHPCVIACFLGLILFLTQFPLPEIILTPLRTVGRCNTALSMMVIGMILSEIDPHSFKDADVFKYSLQRLIVIPLIVFAVCSVLPVSPMVRGLSTILAGMPAGATTSMLAENYDRDPGFATRLVIVSTLLSLPTICAWSLITAL